MKQLLTTLILLVAFSLHAQEEWALKMKPWGTNAQDYWALYDGVGFSLGEYVFFGMGYRENYEVSATFRKYHPATNTFTTFTGGYPDSGFSNFNAGAGGIGFAIGDVGYAGLGGSGFDANDSIFRYTLAADHFWALEPIVFPGGRRFGAISFVIGDKAYIGGGGSDESYFNPTRDLWAYSATTGWTQRANMPATIEAGTAFALDGKGYVISRAGTQLWCYDPITNAWTTKAPYPGGARDGAVAFTKDGKGYMGSGYRSGVGRTRDFFAYDPASDSWSAVPELWDAYGRQHAIAVSHGNKAYVIGGNALPNTSAPTAEIWELGPPAPLVPGTWVQRPYLPAAPRERPATFVIDDIMYLAGGNTGFSNYLNELWAYDPEARTWTTRAALPVLGAQVGAAIDGKGYVLIGTDANNFWAYDPVSNSWTQRADMPSGTRDKPVAFGLNGRVYVGTGMINTVRQSDLWAYDPVTNSWEQRTSMAGTGVHSAAAFVIDNKGCISAGNLNGSSTASSQVRCYDPATNSWSSLANFMAPNQIQGHMAFAIGDQAFRAGGYISGTLLNAFHSYDLATNAWTVEASAGGGWRREGAAAGVAGRGFLTSGYLNPVSSFPTSGERVNDLWEYIPTNYVANPGVEISARVMLGGPFINSAQGMNDQLRTNGLIPLSEPYSALGYSHVNGGGETTTPAVLATSGNNAIVDWVVIELRSSSNPSNILATRSALVQRDGDVVDVDGSSPVTFNMAAGSYHIAIKHRNHLSCMSANAYALSPTSTIVDLTSPTTTTWGTNARKNVNGTMVLWAGDCTRDGQVKYTGTGNDRDLILQAVGGVTPTATVAGYRVEDVNMDGIVIYTGTGNDRDRILENIGGTVPTNVVVEQLP
ncbi:MAG: kelch repeat-containing protein [Flavobacteriales bacterium]